MRDSPLDYGWFALAASALSKMLDAPARQDA
jgi:hypothetical protein